MGAAYLTGLFPLLLYLQGLAARIPSLHLVARARPLRWGLSISMITITLLIDQSPIGSDPLAFAAFATYISFHVLELQFYSQMRGRIIAHLGIATGRWARAIERSEREIP
jgi:hypothetical protein